jgi:hypothetical protein
MIEKENGLLAGFASAGFSANPSSVAAAMSIFLMSSVSTWLAAAARPLPRGSRGLFCLRILPFFIFNSDVVLSMFSSLW